MIYNFDFKIDISTHLKLSENTELNKYNNYKLFTDRAMISLLSEATTELFNLNLYKEYKIRFINIPYTPFEKRRSSR